MIQNDLQTENMPMAFLQLVFRLCFFLCILFLIPAYASDDRPRDLSPKSASLFVGYGNGIAISGLRIRSKDLSAAKFGPTWNRQVVLDGAIAGWQSTSVSGGATHIVDVSITPVLRIERSSGQITPFWEMGIGLHMMNHVQIANRHMSTAFQFGEHIGAGLAFGTTKQYEAGLFIQHESNGSIKKPNSGLTYLGLSFSRRF